jgi:hypothetical protein
MQQLTPVAGILVLAFLCESLVEYLARPVLQWGQSEADTDLSKPRPSPLWLRYIAALTGIVLCLAYRADALASLNLVAWQPWIGQVITGILVGRGSNYLHDLVDRWLSNPTLP